MLAGDALLNHAFALVCDVQGGPDAHRIAALRELASAVGLLGMIGGQYRDVRPEEPVDAAALERTSRLKTGALLGACAACGAIVAGAGDADVATARAFGVELGLLSRSWTTCSTRRATKTPSANRPARTPAAAAAPSRASWAWTQRASAQPRASARPASSWPGSRHRPTPRSEPSSAW